MFGNAKLTSWGLCITNNCNLNKDSLNENLRSSFKIPDGINENQSKSYLANEEKFQVLEYEVFEIIKS